MLDDDMDDFPHYLSDGFDSLWAPVSPLLTTKCHVCGSPIAKDEICCDDSDYYYE